MGACKQHHPYHLPLLTTTPLPAPVKLADGTVSKFVGVAVDVTRKTEGACSAFADGAHLRPDSCECHMDAELVLTGSGLPLLVKYDSRIKDASEGPVQAVLGVRASPALAARRSVCANLR